MLQGRHESPLDLARIAHKRHLRQGVGRDEFGDVQALRQEVLETSRMHRCDAQTVGHRLATQSPQGVGAHGDHAADEYTQEKQKRRT
jgi:hypothetical protein